MAKLGRHSYIRDVADLKSRCAVDMTTLCWHWLGAGSRNAPRLWTFDHAVGDKHSMSGPRAVWNIAHGEAPRPHQLVFRGCGNGACLNPAHLRLAAGKAEIGLHIRRAGTRNGTAVEARRANQRLAMQAAGIVPTPPDVVRAIRAAPPDVTGQALALRFGLAPQTVSRIRRGQSNRCVEAQP